MKSVSKMLCKGTILVGLLLSVFLIGRLRVLGYVGILLLTAGTMLSIRQTFPIDRVVFWTAGIAALLFIRLIVQFFAGKMYDETLRSLIFQLLTYAFLFGDHTSRLTGKDWKWILDICARATMILALVMLLRGSLANSSLFGTMYGNILLVTLGVLFFDFQTGRHKLLHLGEILFAFVLVFFSEMRSALFAGTVGLLYLFLPEKLVARKRVNMLIFVLVIALCYAIPYLYTELYNPTTRLTYTLSLYLQGMTRALTGSRFFSGRQFIWMNVLGEIRQMRLFGGGIGYTPRLIYDTTQTTHNLFLFIRLEQGLVGFLLFLALLRALWGGYNTLEDKSAKIGIQAVFIMLMIQQSFSLGLLGGKGAFSFYGWAVLAAFLKPLSPSKAELRLEQQGRSADNEHHDRNL